MPKRKKKCWSYCVGHRGTNRVRAYEKVTGGRLFLEHFELNGITGESNRKRVSLGHKDKELATEAAEELAATLRKLPAEGVEGPLTVGKLFDRYELERTPQKARRTQANDRRTLAMFRKFLGANRLVESLDIRDWETFIASRRSGTVAPRIANPKVKQNYRAKRTVRNRMIQMDLKLLMAVLNWATKVWTPSGKRLLELNPLRGLATPTEQSPNRPMLTAKEFDAMLAVAPMVASQLPLLMKTAWLTGHRISAICMLRWSDIDLDKSSIHWRGENDKIGFDHDTPLDEDLEAELRAARNEAGAIGDVFIFTSPKHQDQHLPRELARDWWLQAEELARVKHVKGRGWHCLRRQFATDLRNGAAPKDLCLLGGWKNYQTILTSYLHPTEPELRKALKSRNNGFQKVSNG